MRLPLSWIKEYVQLTHAPAQIAKTLTMAGIEVDSYTTTSEPHNDILFEISLTPNLGHCSSLIGIARELSTALELPVIYPLIALKENGSAANNQIQVQIAEGVACPRYACRVIRKVTVGPSPEWLQQRLEQCGLRSVNNIVDITNYVLLEWGHPLHAFDLDKLRGNQIIIKKAMEGERFVTLDGKERALRNTDLVIADAQGTVAIAGVMGGQNSEVSEETINILLEAAYFDPVSVRKTSKHLGLQTDASKRFERGTDPLGLIAALDRASQLIQEVTGGEVQEGIIDIKHKEFASLKVTCRLSRTNQLLGLSLRQGEVGGIFKRLGFHYTFDGIDTFTIEVPTYRVDISLEVDLIEEVARVYGYDHIPRQGGKHHSSVIPPVPIYLFEQQVRTRLIGDGLQEFLTCDLVGPTLLNIVQDPSFSEEAAVVVMNPTSVEQSILRTSLLPGLLQVVKYNVDHQNHQISGFEVGRIHYCEGQTFHEPYVAGIILSGQSQPEHWSSDVQPYSFYDLKGIVENLLTEFGITQVTYKNLGLSTFHTGRQASVFVGELEIGSFGEVHPAIQRRLDVNQRILFGEFNLHEIMQVAQSKTKVKPLSAFPGSVRDWTLTVKQTLPYQQIVEAVQSQSSPLLEQVQLLDIYRSEKLPEGYQNVTLRLGYRDLTKTIAQEAVDIEHARLTNQVIKVLADALRI